MTQGKYDSLIGQTVKDAMNNVSKIDTRIKKIRVSKEDGKSCVLTFDYRTDRLDVETVGGLITKVVGVG